MFAIADALPITTGWKWAAVLIGAGFLLLLYLMTAAATGWWNPRKLIEGEDLRPSTSKLQWLLWVVVILFAYVVLWVLRAKQGNYSGAVKVPGNLLTLLAFSATTAAAAKGITGAYTRTGRVDKGKQVVTPPPSKSGGSGGESQLVGGILQDDTGIPELAKIQMLGFTLVAVGTFLASLIHQVATNPVTTSLPNVDTALLALMGIGQGGYLGKKLVTFKPTDTSS